MASFTSCFRKVSATLPQAHFQSAPVAVAATAGLLTGIGFASNNPKRIISYTQLIQLFLSFCLVHKYFFMLRCYRCLSRNLVFEWVVTVAVGLPTQAVSAESSRIVAALHAPKYFKTLSNTTMASALYHKLLENRFGSSTSIPRFSRVGNKHQNTLSKHHPYPFLSASVTQSNSVHERCGSLVFWVSFSSFFKREKRLRRGFTDLASLPQTSNCSSLEYLSSGRLRHPAQTTVRKIIWSEEHIKNHQEDALIDKKKLILSPIDSSAFTSSAWQSLENNVIGLPKAFNLLLKLHLVTSW